jgi:hypothetical protein
MGWNDGKKANESGVHVSLFPVTPGEDPGSMSRG